MQLKHMHQVSADASFRVVVLGSLAADEQVSQFLPEEEAWLRFKINEMLFHCLDELKVY